MAKRDLPAVRDPLASLIPSQRPAGVEDLAGARLIKIDLIEPNPYQPRRQIDRTALAELAASIRAHGVVQPLTVRKVDDRYQLVAGERRWRASRDAGLPALPCIVRDVSDDQMEVFALLENIQREQLTPVDEAHAYQRLMDRLGISMRALAEQLGKHHSFVQDRLKLIGDPRIEAAVESGALSPTVAVEIVNLPDEGRRTDLLARAVAGESVKVKDVQARRPRKNVVADYPPDDGGQSQESAVGPAVVADNPPPLSGTRAQITQKRRGTAERDLVDGMALRVVQIVQATQGRVPRAELIAALREDLARLEQPE